jgi:hypothetical protein
MSIQTIELVYNVQAFGARGNGSTNDRVAIQSAVKAAFDAGVGVVILPPTKAGYRWTGTVYLPPGVVLRGDRATKVLGDATAAPMIESGKWTGTAWVSNTSDAVGAADRLMRSGVEGIHFVRNTPTALSTILRLHNFNERCIIRDCHFDVGMYTTAYHLTNAFYSDVSDNFIRGANYSGTVTRQKGAIVMTDAQAIGYRGNSHVGCDTGLEWGSNTGGQMILDCRAESCRVGIDLVEQTSAVSILGGYIEANSVAGIRVGASAERTTIDGCYFYNNAVGVDLVSCFLAEVRSGNKFAATDESYKYVRAQAGALGCRVLLGLLPTYLDPIKDDEDDKDDKDNKYDLDAGVCTLEYQLTSYDVFGRSAITKHIWYNNVNHA